MPDVLIRHVPAADLERLDEHARRQGLSRADYLRRRLHSDAQRSVVSVGVGDLLEMGEALTDLADETVMKDAWS